LSKDELNHLKDEVIELRQEYSLLELAMKTLGNAAYGAAANRFFYFYNIALAGDITGECRNLTKTMWHNLEEWFHEGIWERKDIWERFDFELDESKHDWYRKQAVSIYSDTDSVYTTFGTFFDAMTEESQAKYDTDRKKLDWILKYSKEFQDKLNNQWCDEMYNPRHGHNIHEFELETVSKAGIYLKKKKYLKGLVFNKGKYLDKPKVSGTGIELIKSTTPKLCRKILSDLMESLMFDYEEKKKSEYILEFNMKLQNYRNEFYKASIEDISQSVGVGNYKKYVINDEDDFELGKQCPVSVQAIARFNYLAHKNNEDHKKQYAGKIKYYNIRINEKLNGYFGFPAGELPDWAPKMDKLTQCEKTVIDPINRFLEVMNIPLANPVGSVQLDLFG
jgi:DNA polymerase elongation subunit (family B)